jgi:transaldolase
MTNPLESLIACGTKLWLDSIDPQLVRLNRQQGATGATSNPIIIADLVKSGRFDDSIAQLLNQGVEQTDTLAWALTDQLVAEAEQVFFDVWQASSGNDGYVSFELDPLVEDPDLAWEHDRRVAKYVELGRQWSEGHANRMIKIPATPAGIEALEPLAEQGVSLNVTLVFTMDQYVAARDAVWRGAQRRGSLEHFKSVYSIFVSRVDVYTEQHVPQLSAAAQGQVGIVNAKRIWQANRDFWAQHSLPLQQEIVFASTGTKKPGDPPWKYVEALAGSDVQTNPPATNEAVARSERSFTRQIDKLPPQSVLDEIDRLVDVTHLHETLMREGIHKFAEPQHALLRLLDERRTLLRDRS